MKNIIRITVLFLSVVVASAAAKSDISIRYALCRENIDRIEVVPQGNLYSLRIILTESAADDFFQLTRDNIENTLEIVFGSTFISGAEIAAPIESGSILSVPATEEEANRLMQSILGSHDNTFCGRVK